MERSLTRLEDRAFDVLVVGSGIYGAAIAWDAASRGLSVAIVDRGDIGGATSSNSLKTLHGGLRSLQRAAFRDMREFIRERRVLGRIAPHLVHPLPFMIPTHRHLLRNRPLMRMVMAVNDAVAHDRNEGIDPARRIPRGGVVSRDECLRRIPGLDPAGVTGGAFWYDCQMDSADRLTLAFVTSACRSGAEAANYVEAARLLVDRQRVVGIRARDVLSDAVFDIRSRVVVNAAGPWAWGLLGDWVPGARSLRRRPAFSKAMNLVIDAEPGTHAAGSLLDSRFLLLVPWRGVTMAGTSHDSWVGPPDGCVVTQADVRAFQAEVARAFPGAGVESARVRLVHHGLLPASVGTDGHAELLKKSVVIDHHRDGVDGLVTVVGVRYTTARATAERVVDGLIARLGRPARPCRTRWTPLAGGEIDDIAAFEARSRVSGPHNVDDATLVRLGRCYGSDMPAVLKLLEADPALRAPLSSSCEVTHAELVFAVRHEMAVRLTDALVRRTDAGSAGHPGPEAASSAASTMAAELHWPPARAREELAAVDRWYQIPE
jgi:glycerol-3-phosphate dehydrogenase